jgi:hypothetical protein
MKARSASRKHAVSRARPNSVVGVKSLSWGERLAIIDALSEVLDGVYVHLTLKRSLYGFDVVRGLEHLRQQLPTMSDLQFHRELTLLVNRARRAYAVSRAMDSERPGGEPAILVESYGSADRPRMSYQSRPAVRSGSQFRGRVTIDYWNGIPFDRAVDPHAESETGGRRL